MTKSHEAVTHWYPASVAGKRPTPWWYWGRAVYVSRRDYWKITKYFLAVGIPLGAIGVLFHVPMAFQAAMALATIGLLLLAFSLFGLYRMYGHPALRYILRVVDLGGLRGEITVADLHIGTYRHAFLHPTRCRKPPFKPWIAGTWKASRPKKRYRMCASWKRLPQVTRELSLPRRTTSPCRCRMPLAMRFVLGSGRTRFPRAVREKNCSAKQPAS